MKLLIVTQSIDRKNQILGFFHRWVEEFAKNFEKITVICLEKGDYDLPSNVKILSLGKEIGKSRIRYIFNFYKYIWAERKNYDVVFVHMNPIYVILGGFFWEVFRKKIGLWYVHKTVDLKLKIANFFTDFIFTASKESFRLKSSKIRIVGHGIDAEKFKPIEHVFTNKIITVGRITRSKNVKRIIEVFKIIHDMGVGYTFTLVGDSITLEDLKYKSEVIATINSLGINSSVCFIGSKNQNDLSDILPKYDIFVNLSDTGSVDKAVLEAAASGLKIITNNVAFEHIFQDGFINSSNTESIAQKIIESQNKEMNFRDIVIKNYNINSLILKIRNIYDSH